MNTEKDVLLRLNLVLRREPDGIELRFDAPVTPQDHQVLNGLMRLGLVVRKKTSTEYHVHKPLVDPKPLPINMREVREYVQRVGSYCE